MGLVPSKLTLRQLLDATVLKSDGTFNTLGLMGTTGSCTV